MRTAVSRLVQRPVVEPHAVHEEVHAVGQRDNICFAGQYGLDLLRNAVRTHEVIVVPGDNDASTSPLDCQVSFPADGHAGVEMEVASSRILIENPLAQLGLWERHLAIIDDDHLSVSVPCNHGHAYNGGTECKPAYRAAGSTAYLVWQC